MCLNILRIIDCSITTISTTKLLDFDMYLCNQRCFLAKVTNVRFSNISQVLVENGHKRRTKIEIHSPSGFYFMNDVFQRRWWTGPHGFWWNQLDFVWISSRFRFCFSSIVLWSIFLRGVAVLISIRPQIFIDYHHCTMCWLSNKNSSGLLAKKFCTIVPC